MEVVDVVGATVEVDVVGATVEVDVVGATVEVDVVGATVEEDVVNVVGVTVEEDVVAVGLATGSGPAEPQANPMNARAVAVEALRTLTVRTL